jgi:CubicO group peptidase (beta-lactamase class C family)
VIFYESRTKDEEKSMTRMKELPRGDARELGFAPERLNRIGKTMDAAVAARAIPGTVTLVARKGQVVHTHVTGRLDLERDAKLSIDSLFRMYSQTKPITAAVLMTLFEDGAFLLDEPVSKWIPEFANPKVVAYQQAPERVRGRTLGGIEPARREITIFDLLTMTSGVAAMSRTPAAHWPTLKGAWEGTGFAPADTRFNDPTNDYDDLVLALAQNPLHSHPGDTWQYGSDFDVLTLFLTRLTGKSLDALFREKILGPLGMNDSAFYCRETDIDRLVTDHQWDANGKLTVRDRPETTEKLGRSNRRLMSGNGLFGGLLSTPWDYARFAQMLANGGELDGVRILGRKTVELLSTNHIGARCIDLAVGPNYGFGFGVCVRKGIGGSFTPGSPGTFGWGGAAGTWFFVDPVEELVGLFFTHVFGYQFLPTADLFERFEKLTYEALV